MNPNDVLSTVHTRIIDPDGTIRFKHWDICSVCVGLNSSITGAADPMSDEALKETVEWLQWRYDHWTDNNGPSFGFDRAVRHLVMNAIARGAMELERRAKK